MQAIRGLALRERDFEKQKGSRDANAIVITSPPVPPGGTTATELLLESLLEELQSTSFLKHSLPDRDCLVGLEIMRSLDELLEEQKYRIRF